MSSRIVWVEQFLTSTTGVPGFESPASSCNLVGMVPYTFTVTSHIAFTFGLALSIFIGINIIGIKIHGAKFFALFLPRGVPLIIVPTIVTAS
jgi:F0F1-type ATP synthase membrane subunit a